MQKGRGARIVKHALAHAKRMPMTPSPRDLSASFAGLLSSLAASPYDGGYWRIGNAVIVGSAMAGAGITAVIKPFEKNMSGERMTGGD